MEQRDGQHSAPLRFWIAYGLCTLPLFAGIWVLAPNTALLVGAGLALAAAVAGTVALLWRFLVGRWLLPGRGRLPAPAWWALGLGAALFALVLVLRMKWGAPRGLLGDLPADLLGYYAPWLLGFGWLAVVWGLSGRAFCLSRVFLIAVLVPAWVGSLSAFGVYRYLERHYDQRPLNISHLMHWLDQYGGPYANPRIDVQRALTGKRIVIQAEDAALARADDPLTVYQRWRTLIRRERSVLDRKDTVALEITLTANGKTILHYEERDGDRHARLLAAADIDHDRLPDKGGLTDAALQTRVHDTLEARLDSYAPDQDPQKTITIDASTRKAQGRASIDIDERLSPELALAPTIAAYATLNSIARDLYHHMPTVNGMVLDVTGPLDNHREVVLDYSEPLPHLYQPVTARLTQRALDGATCVVGWNKTRKPPRTLHPHGNPSPALFIQWRTTTAGHPYPRPRFGNLWETLTGLGRLVVVTDVAADCEVTFGLWGTENPRGVFRIRPGETVDVEDVKLVHHGRYCRKGKGQHTSWVSTSSQPNSPGNPQSGR